MHCIIFSLKINFFLFFSNFSDFLNFFMYFSLIVFIIIINKYVKLEKKWIFNGNPMHCIGFPLKVHFFLFVYKFSYLFIFFSKKVLKINKLWFSPFKMMCFQRESDAVHRIPVENTSFSTGFSMEIRCTASDFRSKSLSFNKNPMQCIGFSLKVQYFSYFFSQNINFQFEADSMVQVSLKM